jgi:hypothetical protein
MSPVFVNCRLAACFLEMHGFTACRGPGYMLAIMSSLLIRKSRWLGRNEVKVSQA